jgi:hypothetical protein
MCKCVGLIGKWLKDAGTKESEEREERGATT